LHLHPRVDLPDGSCTRVPEGGGGGADEDIHYVAVEQDLDQRPEGPNANLASEGKPRIINHLFKILQLSLLLTRARIRAPFNGEKIFLKHQVTQHH
jgi:hypothetical protein